MRKPQTRVCVAARARSQWWIRWLCAAVVLVLSAAGSLAVLAAEAPASSAIGLSVLSASDLAEKTTAASSREPGELVVFNRSVITFRSPLLGVSAADRARRTRANLDRLLDRAGEGKLEVRAESLGNFVMLDGALALTVTSADADALEGETLEQTTQGAVERLRRWFAAPAQRGAQPDGARSRSSESNPARQPDARSGVQRRGCMTLSVAVFVG
jgi:hypothetical protein